MLGCALLGMCTLRAVHHWGVHSQRCALTEACTLCGVHSPGRPAAQHRVHLLVNLVLHLRVQHHVQQHEERHVRHVDRACRESNARNSRPNFAPYCRFVSLDLFWLAPLHHASPCPKPTLPGPSCPTRPHPTHQHHPTQQGWPTPSHPSTLLPTCPTPCALLAVLSHPTPPRPTQPTLPAPAHPADSTLPCLLCPAPPPALSCDYAPRLAPPRSTPARPIQPLQTSYEENHAERCDPLVLGEVSRERRVFPAEFGR